MVKSTNISVIIPCYNVGEYLIDCLESLVNQTVVPLEIICIDDGSTDNTLEILKYYAEHYSFLKIISQKNLGVSEARNCGYEYSKGDYILFVDSDDIVNTKLLHEFQVSLNEEPNLELFYYNYKVFKENQIQNLIELNLFNEKKFFSSGLNLLSYLLENKNFSGVTWRYIFRRDLFKHKFIGRVHEDHNFSLAIFSEAKQSCYLISRNCYLHRIRNNSLSRKNIDLLYIYTLKTVLENCFTIIKKLELSTTAKRNYILLMNLTYLESLLNLHDYAFSIMEKEKIKKELGLLKILIRIYITNKKSIIKNIIYVFKFSKQYPCLTKTKIALLKCTFTKQHPFIDIINKFNQYSVLDIVTI